MNKKSHIRLKCKYWGTYS